MSLNKQMKELMKDFKNLQNKLEHQSKECNKMIDELPDSEQKEMLKNSYHQAIQGKLDVDIFLKNISKCQK
jgi:hypothetical protein